MPRVRILDAIKFTSYDHRAGDEVELPGDVAATWCHAGLAELVRGDTPETPERSQSTPERGEQAEAGGKPETAASRSRASRTRKTS